MRFYIPDTRPLSNDQFVAQREAYKEALANIKLTGKSKRDLDRRFRPELVQRQRPDKRYNPSTSNRGRNYWSYSCK